ncbi:tyrosine-type recombinase/integrase [Providencia huaxiensis]|uniref:tyrosine-type recombinase/integrase n=2 Tax=Providencia huaxiensis TaxID=2027290 RepID=UPI002ED850C8
MAMGKFNLEMFGESAPVLGRIIETYGFSSKLMLAQHFEMASSSLAGRYKRDNFPADLVVRCVAETGARWSEAENLTAIQIRNNTVTFTKTKGKRNRSIPISEELIAELPKAKGSKRLFKSCYSAFRSALKRTGIELPERQSSHVLRHTFASHFMMSGGNILVLQRILGHTDIKMTMRYAHFAPDHLNDVLVYNPLVKLKI